MYNPNALHVIQQANLYYIRSSSRVMWHWRLE